MNFIQDKQGSFVIMSAILLPVLVVAMAVLCDVGMMLSQRNSADRAADTACQRAIKPTRTMIPEEDVRQQYVLDLFDNFAKQARLDVRSRQASVDWINATLSADLTYHTIFAPVIGVEAVQYSVSVECTGIPPFPHDGEIVLDSNFTKPDGSDVLLRLWGCYDIFNYSEFGWDAGTGPGVEIQDWGGACFGKLPASNFPSRYVVELDSYANSSITKIIELHPGRYRVSVWYHGRIEDTASNAIDLSIKQREPVTGPIIKLFSMAQKGSLGWKYFQTEIAVDRYSIYDLTISAEGRSDSYGGLFNAFNLQYIDTKR